MPRPRVVIAGLGPGDPALLTVAVGDAIARIPHRFVRTARHPSAPAVEPCRSFDAVYESAASIEAVYSAIAEAVVAAASDHGEVLYAVPGSPLVAERSVELLVADRRVAVEVLPGLSFLDLAWDRLAIDPLTSGVRLVDGHRFAIEAAGQPGPLLVGQCDSRQVLSDIKLAVTGEGPTVTVLQRLGSAGEAVFEVEWAELDRTFEPDHLTCLWIPSMAAPVGRELVAFAELVATLRQRCPWDREQTHQSLTRHLLEETYETLEAIEGLDGGDAAFAHLEEELGDLLFQVVFHATLAAEEGRFTLADVAGGIHDKLVQRHPHVFGDVAADTAGQVMANWEQIKKAEKGRASLMDGIPGHLPSLLYAHKVQRKAASVGFDWPGVGGALPKIAEEAGELARAAGAEEAFDELGDLLFAVVNVARHLDIDPEAALRAATAKFRHRFVALERLAAQRGVQLSGLGLAGLDALWDEVKAAGGPAA
jgi:tetrapyrrole methylase family protein/MazG family protein